MRTRSICICIAISAGALVTLAIIRTPGTGGWEGTPQTIQQATETADRLGFCRTSDECDGVPRHGLVVSDRPLTRVQLAELRLTAPQHPGWVGVARVYRDWRSLIGSYDPTCSVVWGELFVFGDPRVIRQLTGKVPESAPRA